MFKVNLELWVLSKKILRNQKLKKKKVFAEFEKMEEEKKGDFDVDAEAELTEEEKTKIWKRVRTNDVFVREHRDNYADGQWHEVPDHALGDPRRVAIDAQPCCSEAPLAAANS